MWEIVTLLLVICSPLSQALSQTKCEYADLSDLEQVVDASVSSELRIWRSTPLPYHIKHVFSDLVLDLSLSNDEDTFDVYTGPNCSVVVETHMEEQSLFNIFPSSSDLFRKYHLHPFNETFVGIATQERYTISRHIQDINWIRLSAFFAGLLLYLLAPVVVRHAVFYYAGGCSAGLLASILVVAIVVYRFAPKKTIGLPIILGGWAVAGYMLRFAYTNVAWLVQDYYHVVIAYFAAWIVGSLAYCYRVGPPTNYRSFNLMQWTLQAVAVLLIYFSAQLREVSVGALVVLLLSSYMPFLAWVLLLPVRFLYRVFTFVTKPFRSAPKPRFLTEEEYEAQARETTASELRKLREYCRSPDANWLKLSRDVRDVRKLSRFAEGLGGHVSDDEVAAYEDYDAPTPNDDPNSYLEEDVDEYRGWEGELRGRRPMSSLSFDGTRRAASNQAHRERLMHRGAATTSRLPPATSRVPQRLRAEVYSKHSPHRSSRLAHDDGDDYYVEDEAFLQKQQLSAMRRQKAHNYSRRREQYMDSDDEVVDDLLPEDDIDQVY